MLHKPKRLIEVIPMWFYAPTLKSVLAVLALTASPAWAADFEQAGPPLVIDHGEAVGSAGPNTSLTGTADTVSVKLGYSTLLKTDLVPSTIVVGSEEVVDVAPVGAMLILTGKALGSTNLHLLDEEKTVIFAAVVEVVPVVAPLPVVQVLATGREPLGYSCGGNACTLIGATTVPDPGACMHPDDIAADGSRCGDRAASVRPSGADGEGVPE